MAGSQGFAPRLSGSEPGVLLLNDEPIVNGGSPVSALCQDRSEDHMAQEKRRRSRAQLTARAASANEPTTSVRILPRLRLSTGC